ncbi:hypothetical protein BN2475_830022 [Paraburkholderia ribeironis]|uniref:Uncharacterized protein n=1 Tax=Paraburkholderia ribeironis TaxID=1247936 RepID=A0A1N7SKB7_9BURK|nr:hypothetical protein BN2475_830022 [Paraburkholderia ribeironis]
MLRIALMLEHCPRNHDPHAPESLETQATLASVPICGVSFATSINVPTNRNVERYSLHFYVRYHT